MSEAADTFDPQRLLCPDGACIGVLAEDGRCSACGRLWDLSKMPERPTMAVPAAEILPAPAAAAVPEEDAGFVTSRRLCPDGACIGVIGDDGRCSQCGRTAEEAPRD